MRVLGRSQHHPEHPRPPIAPGRLSGTYRGADHATEVTIAAVRSGRRSSADGHTVRVIETGRFHDWIPRFHGVADVRLTV